jgi:hypothetical protein
MTVNLFFLVIVFQAVAELDSEESSRFNDVLVDDESTATTMTNSEASVMMTSSSSSKNRSVQILKDLSINHGCLFLGFCNFLLNR